MNATIIVFKATIALIRAIVALNDIL